MAHVIYIHGFLSSPLSKKAEQTKQWLAKNSPTTQYHCPQLSSYPALARDALVQLIQSLNSEPCYLIGSSLGGFWASYLLEKGLAEKAVLVNPAVSPHTRFVDYLGQDLKSYYSDDHYCLGESDLECLAECELSPIQSPQKYKLLVQTDDEVLDYRQAVERYRGSDSFVEEGGDHSFVGFQHHLPAIARFFGLQFAPVKGR